MEHKKTGCQQASEAPIDCANNCGFFGSLATMNLCSKCHKDLVLNRDQPKLASPSIRTIIPKETLLCSDSVESSEDPKGGPSRCTTCRKRIGLTGFNCRCGNLFCSAHRYSDTHDCPFDYRAAGKDAIAKANPVVKAEKVGKI